LFFFVFTQVEHNIYAMMDDGIEVFENPEIPLIDGMEFNHILTDTQRDNQPNVNEFLCPCIMSMGIAFSSAAIMGSVILAYFLKANGYGLTEDEAAYYIEKVLDKISVKVNPFFEQYGKDTKPSIDAMLGNDSLDDPKFLLP